MNDREYLSMKWNFCYFKIHSFLSLYDLSERIMCFKKIVTILILVGLSIHCFADPNKQALKYIYEGSYSKAEQQILKSLSKDSLNPGGHYLYGLLFNQPNYERFDIDSSYFHVIIADNQWDFLDEKGRGKLAKINITIDSILNLRGRVEILAYERARNEMTLPSFDYFFEEFVNDSLSSLLMLTRDSLAFTEAEAIHTWQGYLTYTKDYSDALQQQEAMSRYHQLIYKDKALNKGLVSQEKFLREVKDTPYRNNIEREILSYYTLMNDPLSYIHFIKKYSNSIHVSLAKNTLYYVSHLAEEFEFPQEFLSDSLKNEISQANKALIPIVVDGKFSFVSADGEHRLAGTYDEISNTLKCKLNRQTLLPVFREGNELLVSKSGVEVLRDFKSFSALSKGVYEVEKKSGKGVVLASGDKLLDFKFKSVKQIGNKFFLAEKDNQFHLYSFLGKKLISIGTNEVDYLESGDVLIFMKQDKVALLKAEELAREGFDSSSLSFDYDEVEQVNNEFLLCFSDDQETLLASDLSIVIPLAKQEIFVGKNTIYTKSKWGTQLYNKEKKRLGDEIYQEVIIDHGRIAIKKNDQWNLLVSPEAITGIDSLFFLNEHAVIIVKSAIRNLITSNGEPYKLGRRQQVTVVLDALSNQKTSFLSISKENDKLELLDRAGKVMFETKAHEIIHVTDSLFLLKSPEGMRLVDDNGDHIVKGTYDLIDPEYQLNTLIFHLLKDSKLGTYNSESKVIVAAKYSQKLRLVNDTLLIGKQGDKKGLINTNRRKNDDFEYEHIVVLNDSLLLFKTIDTWRLVNIMTDEVILDEILQIEEAEHFEGFKQIKFRQAKGYGILDSRKGVLLSGIYNEIFDLNKEGDVPYYYVERYLKDSGFYIILYVDHNGEKRISQAYQSDAHRKILCEK